MSHSASPIAKIATALFAISALSFSASAVAEGVKALHGKPTSDQILQALAPASGQPKAGFRTRGLSLGNSDAAKAEAPAQQNADAEPRALDLDIKFEFNSGQLTQDGKDVLDQLGEALKSDELASAKSIVLEGHADAKGNPLYNKVLSLKRAQSAKSYLAGKGIASNKLKAVGKGSSEPADPSNPQDEANRRVRVIIAG
ncbi:MAG: OmpA family protein [Pseudomonadota bacterium]